MISFKWIYTLGRKSRINSDPFADKIAHITGINPHNLSVYRLALRHSSAGNKYAQFGENNERLEYLGDAILGAVVADYLFKKYPFKGEGFLTELRSRIVNREQLNQVAKRIGLEELIEYDRNQAKNNLNRSMNGDALEALVGALYLDRGFKKCRKFIVNKLLGNYYDLDSLLSTESNFKSRLLEFAQRRGKQVRFETAEVAGGKKTHKEFLCTAFYAERPVGKGRGLTKKAAEQQASAKALEKVQAEDSLDG